MAKFNDLTGQKFGRLTVIKRVANKDGRAVFLCNCSCGNTVNVLGKLLTRGTKSCGCLAKDMLAERNRKNKKHGFTSTRLYKIWDSMKQRCYNPNYIGYKDYGGRGICICKEWLNEPTLFFQWAISHGYDKSLSIDRIDVNGNYEPQNCRWATTEMQLNNRRNTVYLVLNNQKKALAEWAKIYKIERHTLYYRLSHGWSVKDALLVKVTKTNRWR